MPDRVVDGQYEPLAVGADAKPVCALPVLNSDGGCHAELGPDIATAVGTLVDVVHGGSFRSPRRLDPARLALLRYEHESDPDVPLSLSACSPRST